MCDSDLVAYNSQVSRDEARRRVTQGLPACLTELGITEVVFGVGTSYHRQQAAFAALCAREMRDSNHNEAWVHGEHLMETDV